MCPACGAGGCANVLDYPDLPVFFFPMPRSDAPRVEQRDLVLHGCGVCGHVFQATVDEDLLKLIYGDYYANYPYDTDEAQVSVYRETFNSMFKLVVTTQPNAAGGRLLEIGCSKADNMAPFVDYGFSCIGIDPSPLAGEGRAVGQVEIISGFYEAVSLPDAVGVIVSRFSLEHIPDAPKYVAKMRTDLEDGGFVFVQVPNLEYYIRNGQPLFGAHEHCHYFTLRSLCALFGRFGMSPVMFYEEDQPSIVACFKKGDTGVRVASANVADKFPAYKSALSLKRRKIDEIFRSADRVVLYGCGLVMIWMLTGISSDELRKVTVVDDNESLWGKFTPTFGIEVKPPDPEEFRDRPRVILSLNPLYYDAVARRLEALNVCLDVVAVEEDGVREYTIGSE